MVLWCICLTACGPNDFIAVANRWGCPSDVQRQNIHNSITWKRKQWHAYSVLYFFEDAYYQILYLSIYLSIYIYIYNIYIYYVYLYVTHPLSSFILHSSACRSSHFLWPKFRSCPLAHAQRIPLVAKTMALRSRPWEHFSWGVLKHGGTSKSPKSFIF